MKAISKFDVSLGYKLSTYATWWIRQSITRAIADQGKTIRIPVHMSETVTKIKRASLVLQQELGREPSRKELASHLNEPEEKIAEIYMITQSLVSTETPIGEENDSTIGEFIIDKQAINPLENSIHTDLAQTLKKSLAMLTPREEKIIRLRYGLDDNKSRTLEEVGLIFNVTRERVRQIEAKAIRKLRHPTRSRTLKDFLDYPPVK